MFLLQSSAALQLSTLEPILGGQRLTRFEIAEDWAILDTFRPWTQPKKEFKVRLKDADKDFIFDASKADLNKFDKIIDEVEPGNLRLPVLIKKYIKQNARVIAFNVDPLFNNAIDGLMYIRISDLPDSTVRPVMEEFQAELEKVYNNQSS